MHTRLMTEWTVIFVPLIGVGFHPDMVHPICIGIDIRMLFMFLFELNKQKEKSLDMKR